MAVVAAAVRAALGPVLPAVSIAPLAAKRAARPPSSQVTSTVRVVPESALGEKTHPAALLALEKSAAATPYTASVNVAT